MLPPECGRKCFCGLFLSLSVGRKDALLRLWQGLVMSVLGHATVLFLLCTGAVTGAGGDWRYIEVRLVPVGDFLPYGSGNREGEATVPLGSGSGGKGPLFPDDENPGKSLLEAPVPVPPPPALEKSHKEPSIPEAVVQKPSLVTRPIAPRPQKTGDKQSTIPTGRATSVQKDAPSASSATEGSSADKTTGPEQVVRSLAGYGEGTGGGTARGSSPGSSGHAEVRFGASDGPRFLNRFEPAYPNFARRLGKEGTVLLRVTINECGRAADVEILQKAGPGFDEEAVRAVRSSTYIPAARDGRPLTCKAILPVRFVLKDPG